MTAIVGAIIVVTIVALSIIVGILTSRTVEPVTNQTNRQVYYLGSSSNTDTILFQLEKGTSNIQRIESLAPLASIDSGSILIIDGNWIGNPNATLSKTAAAIKPLILNGTPVIIIDGSDVIISLAIEDENLSYISASGNSEVPSYGVCYNATTGLTSSFGSFIGGEYDSALKQTVASEYNWASDLIAGLSGHTPQNGS